MVKSKAKVVRAYTKKNRAEQVGTLVTVRMQPDDLKLLDLWIEANDSTIGRPEAVRRILRLAAMRDSTCL